MNGELMRGEMLSLQPEGSDFKARIKYSSMPPAGTYDFVVLWLAQPYAGDSPEICAAEITVRELPDGI